MESSEFVVSPKKQKGQPNTVALY